nr:unnamed protein product [Callosobruchus chinensis]
MVWAGISLDRAQSCTSFPEGP